MVGPGGLEPLTSSVSTYHAYERKGLRPYRASSPHVLYLFHRQGSQVEHPGCQDSLALAFGKR